MFHLERPRFRSHLKTAFQTFALVTHQAGPKNTLAAPKSSIDDLKPLYTTFCSATTSKL